MGQIFKFNSSTTQKAANNRQAQQKRKEKQKDKDKDQNGGGAAPLDATSSSFLQIQENVKFLNSMDEFSYSIKPQFKTGGGKSGYLQLFHTVKLENFKTNGFPASSDSEAASKKDKTDDKSEESKVDDAKTSTPSDVNEESRAHLLKLIDNLKSNKFKCNNNNNYFNNNKQQHFYNKDFNNNSNNSTNNSNNKVPGVPTKVQEQQVVYHYKLHLHKPNNNRVNNQVQRQPVPPQPTQDHKHNNSYNSSSYNNNN
ncbi:unnamed protein product [Ambrosiozyma monospora]|uniref:Unnamed protein product n=1 Tax=Ambrosiozyma monospora TaxID=43982 RepID=A0ACB5U8N2_AMBMO|nr:unnamed protein product [Ambrosiozyma monospora]